MAGILASLIEYCDAALVGRGPTGDLYDVDCPHCSATGVSVIVRQGVFVACLVCGLSISLPHGSSFVQ
jgi:ribosomal protein S27E